MKLCEHLEPIYQNEIANGNKILSIGISYDTGLRLCIFFKDPIISKHIPPDLEVRDVILHSYPTEHVVECKSCRMMLSFPFPKDQQGNYNPSPFAVEDPNVLASKETVVVLVETSRSGVKPTIIDQEYSKMYAEIYDEIKNMDWGVLTADIANSRTNTIVHIFNHDISTNVSIKRTIRLVIGRIIWFDQYLGQAFHHEVVIDDIGRSICLEEKNRIRNTLSDYAANVIFCSER